MLFEVVLLLKICDFYIALPLIAEELQQCLENYTINILTGNKEIARKRGVNTSFI